MAVKIKIVIFWVMAPCNLVGATYPLHLQGVRNSSFKKNGEGTRSQTGQWKPQVLERTSVDRMKSNKKPMCRGAEGIIK